MALVSILFFFMAGYSANSGETSQAVFCGVVGAVFIGLTLFATSTQSKSENQDIIAAEVPMTKVTVKGENDFTSTVKIIYKDGRLDHLELIKGSTQAVPTPTQ